MNVLKIKGKHYIRIGDSLVECSAEGVIQASAEETPNKHGGQDVTVHVKRLRIVGKTNN